MNLKDRWWDFKSAIATIVEGESVGWKDETLFRVPVVDGHPRPDLRNKRKNRIARTLFRESLTTGETGLHTIDFQGLRITRRVYTR